MQEYEDFIMKNQSRACKKLPRGTTLRKELHKAKMQFKKMRDLTKYVMRSPVFANISVNHKYSGMSPSEYDRLKNAE